MVELLDMEDVGRRIDFLMQLQQLWSDGLAALTRGYMVKSDKEMATKLENALELLTKHMQTGFLMYPYSKVINELPKPIAGPQGESNYEVT